MSEEQVAEPLAYFLVYGAYLWFCLNILSCAVMFFVTVFEREPSCDHEAPAQPEAESKPKRGRVVSLFATTGFLFISIGFFGGWITGSMVRMLFTGYHSFSANDPRPSTIPGLGGAQTVRVLREPEPLAPAPTFPPAGWYSDPWRKGLRRYWDGATWTDWCRND